MKRPKMTSPREMPSKRGLSVSSFSILFSLLIPSSLALASAPATQKKKQHSEPSKETAAPSYLTSGPRSDSEAQILADEATSDAYSGKWASAAIHAERFLARYPSHSRYREIQELRGTALLQLKRPAEALPLWRDAVHAAGQSPKAQGLRLRLARTYLDLKRPAEARLLAARSTHENGPLRTEALLLRGEADLHLDHLLDAEMALASARTELQTRRLGPPTPASQMDGHLAIQAEWLNLSLQWARCQKFPSSSALPEAQALDQLGRRGECLLEAAASPTLAPSATAPVNPGAPLLSLPTLDFREKIQFGWKQAIQSYKTACTNPPHPTDKRSPKELRRYREELQSRLNEVCGEKITKVRDVIAPQSRTDEPVAPPQAPSPHPSNSPPSDSHS